MATGKALDGKPYAGNPHVRFDEGEVASAATPRRGSLLYKALNKLLLTVLCVGSSGLSLGFDWASAGMAIVIPSGETATATTEEQVGKLGAAETIEIQAGAALEVRYTAGGRYSSNKCPIPASISGAGRLSFYGVGGAILSGDNSGFSGELFSSNTYLRVQHANALGTASVMHYVGLCHYDRGAFTFEVADASFANEFHFLESSNDDAVMGSRAVHATERAFLTGSVRLTGCVMMSGNLHVKCDIVHDGRTGTAHGGFGAVQIRGDENADIVLDYGDGEGVLQTTANTYWYGGNYRCGRLVLASGKLEFYTASRISFSPNASLQFGSDLLNESETQAYTGGGTLSIPASGVTISFSNLLYVMSMNNSVNTGDLTLRFTGCGPAFGSNVKFENKVNLLYDCQADEPGELLLLSPASTTTGTLGAKRGTLIIGEGARFPNVTRLNLSGEGVIEVRDAAAFAEGAVSVYFEGPASGTLKVAPGQRLTVKDVYVNGKKTLPGSYFGAAGTGAFNLMGGGTLMVNEGRAVTECYWTGKAGDGDARNANNWWTAPSFDGTERLNFINGWMNAADIGKVIFSGDSRVCGIKMSLSKDFEFAAADDASRVIVCPNGPTDDSREGVAMNLQFLQQDSSVAYLWSLPLVFSHGYETALGFWNQQMRFAGTISGGDADHPIKMVRYNWGAPKIELAGDNSGLSAPLEIVNAADLKVTSPTGLGATNRVSKTRRSSGLKFQFDGLALTNETPFEVRAQDKYARGSDTMIVSTNTTAAFVQKGEFRISGGIDYFEIGNSAFLGGITAIHGEAVGDDVVRVRYRGTEPFDCSGGPFRFADASFYLLSENAVDFNLGATGSVWRLLHVERAAINCLATNVLSVTAECDFGSAAYGMAGGLVKLNGFDQELASLHQYADYVVTETSPLTVGVVVDSTEPAVLTLAPSVNMDPAILGFSGAAGLRVRGAEESGVTLARAYSATTGSLTVESGTLVFQWGAGWGGTNVVVSGGTLRFAEGSGDVPFGSAERANVALSGSGKLSIDAGLRVVAGEVSVDGVPLLRGCWGGPDCMAVSPDHRIAALAGQGVLRVTKGESAGLAVIVR